MKISLKNEITSILYKNFTKTINLYKKLYSLEPNIMFYDQNHEIFSWLKSWEV